MASSTISHRLGTPAMSTARTSANSALLTSEAEAGRAAVQAERAASLRLLASSPPRHRSAGGDRLLRSIATRNAVLEVTRRSAHTAGARPQASSETFCMVMALTGQTDSH